MSQPTTLPLLLEAQGSRSEVIKEPSKQKTKSALGREQFCCPVVQPVLSSANAPGICSSTGARAIALARNSQKPCPSFR